MTSSIVIDGGNSATKAVLVQKGKIVDMVSMPSIFYFTPDVYGVVGGAEILGETLVFGEDAANRTNRIEIYQESKGKLDRLPQILAGVVSSFSEHLSPNEDIEFYILTLNMGQEQIINDAVAAIADIKIDREQMNFNPKLTQILPEGYGCGVAAGNLFPEDKKVTVFDIGGGTANLTRYKNLKTKPPRRISFEFQPSGVFSLLEFIIDELKTTTSNGKVDRGLLIQALMSNTYRLMTDFTGLDIKKEVVTGIEHWLTTKEMKTLLNQVIFTLQTGGAVSCCGGGFQISLVRDIIERVVRENTPEDSKFVIPDHTDLLGVLGVASMLETKRSRGTTKN